MGNAGSPFKAVIVLNILHLEDNDEDALLVERALRRAGYAVSLRRARNKPEFVAQFEAIPDLILSDFHLPDFDALGALDQLKDRGLDIPFILVSGAASDEDVMEAMKRGATDFLFKDRLSRLGAAISAALDYRALRQQARETQQALEHNREELDYAFGNAAIGMALTTLDGRWLKVNRALCRTVGYTESELLATDCHSVTAPEDIAEDIELTRRLADGAVSSTQREKRYLHKLGHMVWVQVTASLVHGRDGAPRYRMLQVLDVTHRKAVEERFHATFEQAAVGIAHTTMEGCFLAVNRKLCEMLGYTRDELMALTTLALSHPATRGEHAQLYQEVMGGSRPRFSAEKQWIRKDGTEIWINRTVSRAEGAAGQAPYLIQVIEDITERKRAEQALQESQQSYETLVASLDGIVWEADAQSYRFLFVSRQAERLLGYPVERWIDEPTFWQDHMHPDDRDWALAYCIKATTALRSHDFEYRMIAADGRVVWLRDIVNLVVENGRAVLSRGIMVDITAAKQAQALSERLFRARRVLAECSRALVHAREERGLLSAMCRIVVESGGYVQSHIGLAENDERQTVRPVASAGYEPGYLEAKTLSWAGGGRHAGLTGKVIATGERYISRDIATDPNSRHLMDRARQRGFRSMIGLPLRIEGQCVGAISIYAREKDAFDGEEVALLTTLADDIAFGIASLRKDAARREAEVRLERLTRARKLMAGCNRVVMHADNEAGLMQEICRLAIEAGGFRQAWIGLKTDEALAGVRVVAHAGYGSDNAPMIGASNWGDDGRYRGLASEAIASGEACIARDILNDPAQERKRGRARELEYQSSIALPLKATGQVLGALTLHAAEKDAFDEEEINLLIELAADLSFGISGIRTRDAHHDAERRLRESERRFRETFEQAAVGITRVDLDGALVDVNQKFCDMLGYAKNELLGKHIRDITHRDDYGRGSQYRAELAHRVMKSAAGEKRFVRKDGAVIWARRTMSTACDETGKPQYVISVVEDITESKRAEAERARLAAIVESSNDAIISRSLDGTIQSWNTGAERLFGYSAKEAIGQSIAIIFPPGNSAQIEANSTRIESGETIAPEEVVRRAKDGRLIEVTHKMSPVHDASGRVVAVSVTLWDDTARKRAERALQRKTELAQLLESLARAANEAATPESAMRTCLERICEHGGWALGRLGIYGPDEGERFPENSLWQSNDPARYEPLMRASLDAKYFALHGQFITAVRRQKRPVWLADIAASPGFGRMRVALDCGLRSAFAFPVIVGSEVTAFLEFFGTEAREPDTMLLEAIGSVGAQLARLIERSRALKATLELAAIVEGSNDAIIGRSLDGAIISWNAGAERMLGYAAAEAVGQPIALILPLGHLDRTGEINERVLRGEAIAPHDARRRTKDGRIIVVRSSISPLRDSVGRVIGASQILQDVTTLRQAEEARARLAAIVESSNDAIISRGLDRTILTWNPAAERLFGWTAQEAIGQSIHLIVPPERIGENAPYRDKIHERLPVQEYDTVRLAKDGRRVQVSLSQSPIRNDRGEVIALSLILRDITERKELEQRYRETFDQAAVGIVHTSLDGRYLRVNRKFCEMLGYAESELVGEPGAKFSHPEDVSVGVEKRSLVLDGKLDTFSQERRFIRKDGSTIWTNRTVSLARDAEGEPMYFIRVVEDVTDRKAVEERYRATFDNAPVGIMHTAVGGYRILRANRKLCEMLGYTQEELLRMTSTDFVHPDYRFSDKSRYMEQLLGGDIESFASERRFVRKDGAALWVHRTVSLVRDAAGKPEYFIRVIEDISKRKEAEEAMARERTLLRTIIDALPDRIYVKDCDGRHLLENASSKKQRIPYSEDVVGKTVFDLYPREVAERLHAEDSRIVETGRPLVNRERSAVDASGAMRWFVASKMPFRDTAGRVAGIVGVNRDITERKLETRRREMEYAVTRLLAESASVEEAMSSVIRTICEATSWTYGARWAWNPVEQCLCRAECWSAFELDFDPRDRERWFRMTAGGPGGLLRRAWQAGAPTWIANVGEDTGFRRWPSCAKFGLRGAYAFPIRAGNSAIGLMEFFGPAERKMDEALLLATESIGRQIGQFIQRKEAEEAQGRSEAMLGATFEQAAVGMAIRSIDPREPRWLQVNQKLCDILGYTREELLRLTPVDISPPEERAVTIENIERMYRGEIRSYSREKRYVRKDGRVIWTNISLSTVNGPDGQPTHVVSVVQDINDRKRAEAALHESEEQFRQLAHNIPQVFWITDVQHRQTLYVSPAAERLIGRPLQELHAAPRALVRAVHWEDRARVRAARKDAAAGGYDETYRVVRPDGSIRWVHDRAFPVLDESGAVYRVAGIAEDVTERKQAEERFLQLAHYDVLTSLPNRVLFYDRLKQVLAQARRNQWIVGVMFIDVDRFKNVNDTLGHAVGDQLLRQVSERLTHAVRTGDTVGRLGGDEFAVVLSNLASAQDASLVAQKIMASFSEPFKLDGAEIYVTASIGISLYPDDSADQDVLIRNADAAMYRAKEVGRNSYQFYTPEMNQRALEILNMESSLRRALDRKEYLLYFQPKARIADGETVGMEALLRWQHPERGLISPAVFMPVLEETGLIVPVGEWVLNAVCAQIRAWERAGIKPVPVAVNLSARQFGTHDLGPTIRRILEAHQVDPSLIELEITESSLMANTEDAARTLEFLEALGVGLSIDDFGTGYSSLGYLKRFPLDALKIDRSFVRDITTDPDDATITRAVISMAHSLGLKVIAEGVETEAQLAFLGEYGCDEIQGYFLARPMPAGECGAWLGEGRSLHRAPQVPETAPVVLLVDDDDDTLILLKRSLTKDGYRILAARNAHEALDVLGREHVDVVISDQNMPGVPGVEFLQRVKQLSPRTVRMMTSGHTDFQMVADAVNKGEIFRFLPKSLKEEQLRGDVREALQSRSRPGPDSHYPAPGTMGK